MEFKTIVLLWCLWINQSRTQPSNQPIRPIVNTTLGEIVGKLSFTNGVVEYLGVPYAEAPIDELRFQPPVQKKPFEISTAYEATAYKNACYQSSATLRNSLLRATTTDETISLSSQVLANENCLYLNIYTPVNPNTDQTDEFHPVMVFLHGGNFISGTGSAYNGLRLATNHEVVVVTINYRLGVFGFLSNLTESFSANLGLQDQHMALNWIKDNIKAFGGDPSKVTLFGEEAGGSSAHLHALMMNDALLFHNVIVQSARYDDGVLSKKQCQDQFRNFVSDLGYSYSDPDLLILLQNISVDDLYIASQSIAAWRPCIDQKLIHDFPQKIIQSSSFRNEINLLIGTNTEVVSNTEYNVTSDEWIRNVSSDIVTSSFPQLYGIVTDDDIEQMTKNYLQFYSTLSEDELSSDERKAFIERTYSDQLYKTWVQEVSWETSEKSAEHSVYNYAFSLSTDSNPSAIASLSSELRYIFGYRLTTLEEQSLSQTMMSLWTNFAKTGNPNGNNEFITWPPYESMTEDSIDCRQSLIIYPLNTVPTANEVVSRNWEFWTEYYNLLKFSCTNETEKSMNDDPETAEENEECESTVKDALGWNVTNEDAAIMLIVFICTTAVFLLVSIITSVCCCLYKKRLKKLKKKNKEKRRGNDNPTLSEYKL